VEVEKKGISTQATAFIFAAYNISAIVVSSFMDIIIGKIGRRKTLLLGMLSEGVSYLLLGIIVFIDHKSTFIGLAIAARIIAGFGGSCVMTTIYAIVLNFYKVNQARALAYSETAF
jgi:MFS family permease